MSPEIRHLLLLCCGVAGYLVLLATNPIRSSLRDGFRCMKRYPALWTTLAVFGLCYALFQLALRLLEFNVLPEGDRPVWQWSRPWFLPHADLVSIARTSVLPAIEGVSGIFNNVITTFPFSALAALLLLVNWQGHHVVLNRALRKRFGVNGWWIYTAITICAVAAVAKPIVSYFALPSLAQHVPGAPLLAAASIVDWLSFLFEYLFGVCIQIYLILLVYVWVRGLQFTREHLLDFAIRRFSAVMKWTAIVMALSTVFLYGPLILSSIVPNSFFVSGPNVVQYVDRVARPLLALFLLAFCTLQITLTFHSESLRRAMKDHFKFLRKNAVTLGWFLAIAFIHFYAFSFLNGILTYGLGEGTAEGILWQIAAPILQAFIAGWMLASWVCVFRRADTGRSQHENWIAF